MFGFIGKFKTDVLAGFDSVHQRLVTLEAKVEALFHHVNSVPAATVAAVQAVPAQVEAAVVAPVEAVVAEVKNDAA